MIAFINFQKSATTSICIRNVFLLQANTSLIFFVQNIFFLYWNFIVIIIYILYFKYFPPCWLIYACSCWSFLAIFIYIINCIFTRIFMVICKPSQWIRRSHFHFLIFCMSYIRIYVIYFLIQNVWNHYTFIRLIICNTV